MRISCPNCAATYDVPDTLLGARRQVRCARCKQDWLPEAAATIDPPLVEAITAPPPAAPPPPQPRTDVPSDTLVPAIVDQPALSGRVRLGGEVVNPAFSSAAHGPVVGQGRLPVRAGAMVWLGWMASLGLLLALGWGGLTWRNEVTRIWPPSLRLYAALGLMPSPHAATATAPPAHPAAMPEAASTNPAPTRSGSSPSATSPSVISPSGLSSPPLPPAGPTATAPSADPIPRK